MRASRGNQIISLPLTYWKWSYQISPRLFSLFILTFVLTDKSCYSKKWIQEWNTNYRRPSVYQPRRENWDVFVRGRKWRALVLFFLTCFVGDCCTTTSTTWQSDSSDSAWAQLWHYLQMVNKEKKKSGAVVWFIVSPSSCLQTGCHIHLANYIHT